MSYLANSRAASLLHAAGVWRPACGAAVRAQVVREGVACTLALPPIFGAAPVPHYYSFATLEMVTFDFCNRAGHVQGRRCTTCPACAQEELRGLDVQWLLSSRGLIERLEDFIALRHLHWMHPRHMPPPARCDAPPRWDARWRLPHVALASDYCPALCEGGAGVQAPWLPLGSS